MTIRHASTLGVLWLGLISIGCSGPTGSTPVTPSAITQAYAPALRASACSPVLNAQDFDSTPISRNSWIWFTSELSVPGQTGQARVEMWQSLITLRAGNTTYRIEGPSMHLVLTANQSVRLNFKTLRDHWRLEAPNGTTGSDFLDATSFFSKRGLPADLQDVTWSAKFFSKSATHIRWKWAATVYSAFSGTYGKLHVKPLEDRRYPPYNADPAGTPEAYKQYAIGGATDGRFDQAVEVTPCRI